MHFLAPRGISRRRFLQGGAAAVAAPLTVGIDALGRVASAADAGDGLVSDFVRVTADDRVVVVVKHFEAGQGPATGLATLVAEELEADWDRVGVVFAPADNSRYANLAFGVQGTGGSTAIANSFIQYREAGAVALARLKAAAAAEWGTDPGSVTARDGELRSGSRRARFGEMAAAAGRVAAPVEKPALKSPADFSLIGRDGEGRLPRKDLGGKTTGEAVFAMDRRPANVLRAVVARPPRFGGRLVSFDDSGARGIRGYVGARSLPTGGVAVYGESVWAAVKARRALRAEWDDTQAETRSSARMFADYREALDSPGLVARADGDADGALAGAATTVAADFEFPFLAHAPMEPLNCVMEFRDGRVTVWDGAQFPGAAQGVVASVFGVPPESVAIETLYAGGTFGRRATPTADYQLEAAHALLASPAPGRPLQTVWTREDDIRGGYYRPMYVHRARAAIGPGGDMLAWRHDLAGKSILIGTPFEAYVQDGVDSSSVEGLSDLPYSVPNLRVEVRNMQESPVPVLWWRSVGHTHTAFAGEVVVDMLAEAAGEDPVDYRLRHLGGAPRHAGVLRAVADAADWAGGAPAGRFRGVALHKSFGSYVAQVVEVSRTGDGAIRVEKVWCAIDCGIAVNPDVVRAQVESGVGYGLGAAMRNRVTLGEGGEVVESNFPDYEPLRMRDMPEVETVIVKSSEAPTGVGEPGVPPVAPALAEAIHQATGERVTRLPFSRNGVRFA